MKSLSAKGIVLRRLDYGEADRIITFLTKETGKINAIAKGVRKSKSKLAGGIELFSVSELHYIRGKGDIDTLVSTRLITHYANIVKDLARTELAYSILKSINKSVEDSTGGDYFEVVEDSLAALDNTALPLDLVEVSFDMRIMHLQGRLPDFTVDSKGSRLDADKNYKFDSESVSFLPKQDGRYDKNHIKVLKLLAYNSPQSMVSVQGIDQYCIDLKSLITNLYSGEV